MTNSINSIKNSIKNSVVNNANNAKSQPDKFLNYKLGLQALSLLLILYFYIYDIFQYCSKKPCFRFINVSCKNLFFIIFSLLVIFEIGYLAYISNEIEMVTRFPRFWWILAMFLTVYVMRMVHLTMVPVENDPEVFKSKPNSVLSRKKRPIIIIVILLLVISSLLLEVVSQYLETKEIPSFKNLFNKYDLPLKIAGFTKFGSIPILLFLYSIHKNFSACGYNLPTNWND